MIYVIWRMEHQKVDLTSKVIACLRQNPLTPPELAVQLGVTLDEIFPVLLQLLDEARIFEIPDRTDNCYYIADKQ